MSDFTPPSLATRTGYSARQIQRLADLGEIPGAYRTAGGHWRFEDSADLRRWCVDASSGREKTPTEKKTGHDNYVPHVVRLVTVLRRTVPGMDEAQREELRQAARPLVQILSGLSVADRCAPDSLVVARRLVGYVLADSNPALGGECLALVTGIGNADSSMAAVAKRMGVSRQAVSKRCAEIRAAFGL